MDYVTETLFLLHPGSIISDIHFVLYKKKVSCTKQKSRKRLIAFVYNCINVQMTCHQNFIQIYLVHRIWNNSHFLIGLSLKHTVVSKQTRQIILHDSIEKLLRFINISITLMRKKRMKVNKVWFPALYVPTK